MFLNIKGHVVIIDDDDYEKVKDYNWTVREYACGRNVVLTQKWNGELKKNIMTYIHRLVLNTPKHLVVDHINGDCLDNRKENLRVCTRQQNIMNQKTQGRGKTSKYKGVYKPKNNPRYRARCKYNGEVYDIWCASEREAALAYNELALKYHGNFARLNVIEGE